MRHAFDEIIHPNDVDLETYCMLHRVNNDHQVDKTRMPLFNHVAEEALYCHEDAGAIRLQLDFEREIANAAVEGDYSAIVSKGLQMLEDLLRESKTQ